MDRTLSYDVLYLIAERIDHAPTFLNFALCCHDTAQIAKQLRARKRRELASHFLQYFHREYYPYNQMWYLNPMWDPQDDGDYQDGGYYLQVDLPNILPVIENSAAVNWVQGLREFDPRVRGIYLDLSQVFGGNDSYDGMDSDNSDQEST